MTQVSNKNYYIQIHSQMMREFNAMYRGTRRVLKSYFSHDEINRLKDKSEKEYEDLFQNLPYIGGRSNDDTINLIMGAIVLAIVRPLEKEKLSRHQIGKVIYHTFDEYFRAKPAIIRRAIGWLATSSFFVRRMTKQIERSSRREYEDDFVKEYVESEGQPFDFGYNYTECAIQKLYAKHDATKYLRYVCLGDYAMFRSLGIGFTRTRTIANGAAICDFRFSKKGNTPTGWPPVRLVEWSKK